MPDWMLVAIDLIKTIPGVVWGAVLAALIAFGATTLTNRNSRKQLRMQLIHDAQQRDRERALALKRDVYLPAAEALVGGQQVLGELVNLEVELGEVQQVINKAFAAASKVHVVGNEHTVRALLAFLGALVPAYFEVLQLRLPIALRANQAKLHRSIADKAAADLVRTTELMKQFNLSGQTDRAAWDRLVRQSDSERKIMQEYAAKAAELLGANTAASHAMGTRAAELAVEVGRYFPDAVIAARNELSLPIDEATYRQLLAQQEAAAVKVTAQFFEQLRQAFPGAPEAAKEAHDGTARNNPAGFIRGQRSPPLAPVGHSLYEIDRHLNGRGASCSRQLYAGLYAGPS
jgi:hypothetical protein